MENGKLKMDGVGANHVRPGKDANVRKERWEMKN
jgi:hypothetical protein